MRSLTKNKLIIKQSGCNKEVSFYHGLNRYSLDIQEKI